MNQWLLRENVRALCTIQPNGPKVAGATRVIGDRERLKNQVKYPPVPNGCHGKNTSLLRCFSHRSLKIMW